MNNVPEQMENAYEEPRILHKIDTMPEIIDELSTAIDKLYTILHPVLLIEEDDSPPSINLVKDSYKSETFTKLRHIEEQLYQQIQAVQYLVNRIDL